MTNVLQYNDFACFTACLESFLRDIGRPFDHETFIKDNLDLFNGGTKEEGSCDDADFPKVAERLGIKFERIYKMSGITFSHLTETILFGVFWNGKESDKHVVRYFKKEAVKIKVMNPKIGDIDEIKTDWIVRIYKFSAV